MSRIVTTHFPRETFPTKNLRQRQLYSLECLLGATLDSDSSFILATVFPVLDEE